MDLCSQHNIQHTSLHNLERTFHIILSSWSLQSLSEVSGSCSLIVDIRNVFVSLLLICFICFKRGEFIKLSGLNLSPTSHRQILKNTTIEMKYYMPGVSL